MDAGTVKRVLSNLKEQSSVDDRTIDEMIIFVSNQQAVVEAALDKIRDEKGNICSVFLHRTSCYSCGNQELCEVFLRRSMDTWEGRQK